METFLIEEASRAVSLAFEFPMGKSLRFLVPLSIYKCFLFSFALNPYSFGMGFADGRCLPSWSVMADVTKATVMVNECTFQFFLI